MDTREFQILFTVSSFITFMCCWSHIVCATTDPGYLFAKDNVKSDKKIRIENGPCDIEVLNNEKQLELCKRCNAPKDEWVHHCSICNKCIYKMDHHCPWINNCVGYYTIKPFILFNFYLALICIIGVFIQLYNFIWVKQYGLETILQIMTPYLQPWLILVDPFRVIDTMLMFGCMGFAIFGAVMIARQMQFMVENSSTVDELKGIKRPKKELKDAFLEAFGEKQICLRMLIPVNSKPKFNIFN